ncbi:MAG: CoB--CoM heterodisulfide reductase iron-sulfur subunit A family protein [Dehalococcoidia bacterium]
MVSQDSITVIGGGISGVTVAAEAAEVGYNVTLIEKGPYLGGRVSRMHSYFPKLCAPDCGMEINYRRIKNNPKISVITQGEIKNISGNPGNYDVTVKVTPRMVNDNCTACGKCAEVCPVERANDFNYGMDKTRAIYLSSGMAFPMKYTIDREVCPGTECGKCVEACAYNAIDLGMTEETLEIKTGGIVIATGWKPYDATKLDNLAFGQAPNVITNAMMERLAAVDGPTGGKILRPSDNAEPKSIAFVQCAGSRDQNHLPYCSGVCCMGSLKQINYVKEQYPDCQISMFYIDIRAQGYLEDFLVKVQEMENVSLIKGKVAKITEVSGGSLKLEVEDIAAGNKINPEIEMVVLATGLVPSIADERLPGDVNYDDYGFVAPDNAGIVGAGCAKRPTDVSSSVMDATGATIKAIQSVVGGGA